jgi:hypothetical protein
MIAPMATPVVHIDCSQDLQFKVDVRPPNLGPCRVAAQYRVAVGGAFQRHPLGAGPCGTTFTVSRALLAIVGTGRQIAISVIYPKAAADTKTIEFTFHQDPDPDVDCTGTNLLTVTRTGKEPSVTVRLECEPCP